MYDLKEKQLNIIEKSNPAPNNYSAWIRSAIDIMTLQEALNDDDYADYDEFNPDYTRKMALKNSPYRIWLLPLHHCTRKGAFFVQKGTVH